jgi:hypothetical protein
MKSHETYDENVPVDATRCRQDSNQIRAIKKVSKSSRHHIGYQSPGTTRGDPVVTAEVWFQHQKIIVDKNIPQTLKGSMKYIITIMFALSSHGVLENILRSVS